MKPLEGRSLQLRFQALTLKLPSGVSPAIAWLPIATSHMCLVINVIQSVTDNLSLQRS